MKKLLIIIGAAIVAIALLVTVASIILSGSSYDEIMDLHSFIYSPEDKEVYVLYDGEVVGSPIECDKYQVEGYSEDYTICFFKTTSGEGEDAEVKYYLADKDEIIALPETDLKYSSLSADGEKLFAYEETKNDDGSIDRKYYIYDIDDASKTEFKYSGDSLESVERSKNFESILYTSTSGEGEDETTTLYLYTDGESIKLGANLYPVAVSDNAKYIYAYSQEKTEENNSESYYDLSSFKYTLYTLDDEGNKTKIADKFDRYSEEFNTDLSQMLFIADEKAYFYEHGEEKVKIAGNAEGIYSLTPQNVAKIDDFCGTPVIVYGNGSSIYRVEDDEADVEKIATDVSTRRLSNDGETIYFLKNGSLRSINVNDPTSTDEILVKNDVETVLVSNDGKNVYIVDKNDTLYYVEGAEETTRIADDVEDVYMTIEGTVLYTDEDNVLYCSENGKKGEKIDDDVCYVEVELGTVVYYADKNSSTGNASVSISDDGTSFEKVAGSKEFRIPGSEYNY